MSKLKIGDNAVVVNNGFGWVKTPIGTKGTVVYVYGFAGGYRFVADGDDSNVEWNMFDGDLSPISVENSTESTTKKIKQALLRLYLSDTNKTIKSEKIIEYVKQEIGTEYVFGDTILRALRQLRQDGKLDYEIDGAKQDRNYKFKAV
jgi:hypothetical protein